MLHVSHSIACRSKRLVPEEARSDRMATICLGNGTKELKSTHTKSRFSIYRLRFFAPRLRRAILITNDARAHDGSAASEFFLRASSVDYGTVEWNTVRCGFAANSSFHNYKLFGRSWIPLLHMCLDLYVDTIRGCKGYKCYGNSHSYGELLTASMHI